MAAGESQPEVARDEGLEVGETRFMEPISVDIQLGAIRSPVPIAAYQFALAAQRRAA